MAIQNINTTHIVSHGTDTFKSVLTIDPADKNTSAGVGRFSNLKISNSGYQPIEVQIGLTDMYTSDADTSSAMEHLTFTLNANEYIYFPHSKIFGYNGGQSSALKAGSNASPGPTGTFEFTTGPGLKDASTNTNATYSTTQTAITVEDSDYFKVPTVFKK